MAYSKKNMIELALLTEQLQGLDKEHRKLQTKYNSDMLDSNKEIFELQTQMNYLKADMKDSIEAQAQKAAEDAKKSFTSDKLQLEDTILKLESKLRQAQEQLTQQETTLKQLFSANANLENQLKTVTELADKKYIKVLDRALVDENFFKKLLEAQEIEANSSLKMPEGFTLIEEKRLKKLETDLLELQTSLEQERNQNEVLMLNVAEFEKKQKAFMSNFHSQKLNDSGKFDSNFFKQAGNADPQVVFGQDQPDKYEFKQSNSLSDSKFFEMIGEPGNIEDKFRSNYHFNVQAEKNPASAPLVLGVWFDVLYIKQGKVTETNGEELVTLKSKIDQLEKEVSSERQNRITESRLRAAADLRSFKLESEKKQIEARVESLKTESNSKAIHLSVVQEKLEFVKGLLSEMQAKEPKVVEIVKYIQAEPQQNKEKPSIDVTAEILKSLKNQRFSEQSYADKQKIEALEKEILSLRAQTTQPTKDDSLDQQLADLKKLTETQEQDILGLKATNQKLTEEIISLKQTSDAATQKAKAEDHEAEKFFEPKAPKFAPVESLSLEDLPQIQPEKSPQQQPQTVDSFVGLGANMPNYRPSEEEETTSQRQRRLIGGVAIQRITSYDAERTGVIDFVGAGVIAEDEDEEVRPVNLGGNFGRLPEPINNQQMNRPDLLGSAFDQHRPGETSQLIKSNSSNRPMLASIEDIKEFEKGFFKEYSGSPGTPQLPVYSHQDSFLQAGLSYRDSANFEFLGSPKKEIHDSSSQEPERLGEIKNTKTSPMENLRFDIQALQNEARRENDPVNKFDSTFGTSQIQQKVEAEDQELFLNVEVSGVILSAKSTEHNKLKQMIKQEPKLQSKQEEDNIYQNLEESGVITSAKDFQRDQLNNIFKSNRGEPIPTDMEESQVTSGAKDSDQGKMQAMLHGKSRGLTLPPLKHLNSIESQLAKQSETPTSLFARDSIGQSEREKFENKIKFLQSKVKELEYKLTIADSGVGSSTPLSPFTHKSNRQQQELLNKYSSYLNNKQIEPPYSYRTIPRLRTSTSPLPSLPHLFQDINQHLDPESNKWPDRPPASLIKKTTLEIGFVSGTDGTENQETSRFNTYSHPKNINYSLFGKPELESNEHHHEEQLIGEHLHEPRISQLSKGLASGTSKMIREVGSDDQTPNEKNFLSVSGFMPGLKRLNKDAVGTSE